MVRGFLAGLGLGAAWGVLARVFMRLLATDPAFSWSGTLSIVGLAAVAGGLVGLVRAALASGRSGWWRLAAAPGLVLFAGPGVVLLPGTVGMAMVLRGRTTTRVAGALLTTAPLVLFASSGEALATTPRELAGLALFLVSTVPLGWALAEVAHRRVPAPAGVSVGRPRGAEEPAPVPG